MKQKSIIWVTCIICLVLYLIPNLFYIYHFSQNAFSSDPAIWGQYGDFIGGSINPVLTIANIIALVYLTYTVNELETNRTKEIHHIQDRRAMEQMSVQKLITLNQMRHEVVTALSKQMQLSIDTPLDYSQYFLDKIIILETFISDKKYLFNDLLTVEFESSYILPLKKNIGYLQKHYAEKSSNEKQGSEYIKKYEQSKSTLIDNLYRYIINELSTHTN